MNNIDIYNSRMAKSFKDKLFFFDFIGRNDIDCIVDFGCADGTLTRIIANQYPNCGIIGFDECEEQIKTAYSYLTPSNLVYVGTLKGVSVLTKGFKHKALLMSSVIHEIFNYKDDEYISRLKEWVKDEKFEYIIIRDFCINTDDVYSHIVDLCEKEIEEVKRESATSKLLKSDLFLEAYKKQYEEFKNLYSDPTVDQFIHFMLKRNFKENWDRELHEDYTVNTEKKILSLFGDAYRKYLETNYILPYVKYDILREFSTFEYIETLDWLLSNVKTHIKLILKRQ